jgi:iron(II)-dependent oxidoreductase
MMGSDVGESDELPIHTVDIESFIITVSEVTVAEYEKCVDLGGCTVPSKTFDCAPDKFGNWGVEGREDYPVNCVSWHQASDYCFWSGYQLPSEAQWEYAARSRGQDITYPWGDEVATCDYAVMNDGGYGCGTNRAMPNCSMPDGNTEQELCDMAGNLWEWVSDKYHGSYDCDANPDEENCSGGGVAPDDGSAWYEIEGNDLDRCLRGGGFEHGSEKLRATNRGHYAPEYQGTSVGFRCVQDDVN